MDEFEELEAELDLMPDSPVNNMQPDPPGTPQTVVIGQNAQFANNPNTAPQAIYLPKQPSVAPTIIGILTIMYGGASLILSLFNFVLMDRYTDPSSMFYDPVFAENHGLVVAGGVVLSLLLIGCIIGGFMIMKRKKKGVYVAWGTIGAMTFLNIATELILPGQGVGDIVLQSLCGVLCAVLVAIPLMDVGFDME